MGRPTADLRPHAACYRAGRIAPQARRTAITASSAPEELQWSANGMLTPAVRCPPGRVACPRARRALSAAGRRFPSRRRRRGRRGSGTHARARSSSRACRAYCRSVAIHPSGLRLAAMQRTDAASLPGPSSAPSSSGGPGASASPAGLSCGTGAASGSRAFMSAGAARGSDAAADPSQNQEADTDDEEDGRKEEEDQEAGRRNSNALGWVLSRLASSGTAGWRPGERE